MVGFGGLAPDSVCVRERKGGVGGNLLFSLEMMQQCPNSMQLEFCFSALKWDETLPVDRYPFYIS